MKKNNSQSQTFPVSIMTNEKWWTYSEANKAFTNREPIKVFATPSCHGGGVSTDETSEDENGGSTTKGGTK